VNSGSPASSDAGFAPFAVHPADDSVLTPGVYWPKDRTVRTDDGADIAYTFLGRPPHRAAGPVVALCSGFLCPDTWWYHLAPALASEGYSVLVFHYRGIAQSTLPAVVDRSAFAIPRLAADLGAIVAEEQLDDLVLVGHSMGVQVMLEAYRLLRWRTRRRRIADRPVCLGRTHAVRPARDQLLGV
jgi:pimeloyl-ACP methyl ester carboxylesterase